VKTTVTSLLFAAVFTVLPLTATAWEPPRHAVGFFAGESFCGVHVYESATEIHVADRSFRVPVSAMRIERMAIASPLAVLGIACIGYALHRRSRKAHVPILT
jgi:hypothetical protein